MKGKKILAGILSAAMLLGTMAFPAFADDANVVSTTDELVTALSDTTVKEITISGTIDVSSVDFSSVDGTKIKGDPSDGEDVLKFEGKPKTVSIAFADLTLEWSNADYQGLQHSTKITYDNCTIKGQPFLYAKDEIFNNCTFIQKSSDAYNVWTYGAENVEFNNCTFNSAGKSVLIYNEGTLVDGNISVKECTFNASSPVDGKAAIEVDSTFSNYEIDIDAKTTATGFGTGSTSGNSLYNVKKYKVVTDDTDNSKKLNTEITVDGETVMPLSDEIMTEVFGESVARIGGNVYTTLEDAVKAAKDGATVQLLSDSAGNGIVVNPTKNGLKNLTIDFGGFTYTLDGTMVGSGDTTTNGFQLLAGDDTANPVNITFKNGKITSAKAYKAIQNYSNLTLQDMTVELTTVIPAGKNGYTLSNNNGNTVLTGNTNIIAATKGSGNPKIAFDVCRFSSYPGVTVTLDENMTGTIEGNVEFSNDTNIVVESDKFNFTIKSGNVNGRFVDARAGEQKNVAIGAVSGGTFSDDSVKNYLADGFAAKKVGDKWIVDDSATKVSIGFVPSTTDARVYDIVVNAVDADEINRLNTADLTFALTASNAADSTVSYTVTPAKDITLTPDLTNENRYMFSFNTKDSVADTGTGVTIGQVRFEGYTVNEATITFETVIADSLVTATTKSDNLVTYFGADGGALSADATNVINGIEFAVPTNKLTVNIAMNNKVNDNEKTYQKMKVAIAGGTYSEEIELGTDGVALTNDAYVIERDLAENTPYTVTVSGEGYRTARYTVTMNADKVLNFWNNVKDKAVEVEAGKEASAKEVTFLAGDIVKDGTINIYDLSAVVSYFGTINNVDAESEYAKYDLNRDGKIDSKDVAYVLVSWGK